MITAEADAEAQRPNTDELIGRTVGGRFHITDRIARGGMACVYFATQRPLNRPAAIKVLRADGGAEDQESFRRRFIQEASMLSQLQHPNIVTLLDYGQVSDFPGDHYFIAMEYLNGETLAKRLRARGALTVIETLRLARQIGRALREAHRRGFVHRDLKPSNIMLVPEDDQNDIVKLVDFGIGKIVTAPNKAAGDEEDMTRVGLLLGSPRHMAPEQIRGEAIEPRTDLYGLGIILFQALSGRLPFDGRTEVEILLAHCSTPAPKLSETCLDRVIPEPLSNLVDSLLRKDASARPTIYEFLLRLADVEDEVFGALGMAVPTLSIPPSVRWPAAPALSERPSARPSELRTIADQRVPAELSALLSSQEMAVESGVAPSPLSSASRRKKRVGIVFGLLLCFAAVVIGVLFWRKGDSFEPPPVAASLSAARIPDRQPTPAASTFALSIDSTPSGAAVTEGGVVLGKTPLTLAVEHAAVVLATRHFEIVHDGYAAYPFEQRDAASDVTVVAKLKAKTAPLASAVSSNALPSVPRSAPRVEPIKANTPATAYAVKGDDSLEIRTRR